MDNKQILEEIDIIVKAKVDEAKDDIKKVTKEIKNMVNSYVTGFNGLNGSSNLDGLKEKLEKVNKYAKTLTEEFQKISNSDGIDNLSKKLNKSKKDIKETGDEIRKIQMNIDGLEFSYNYNDLEDFENEYNKAFEGYRKQMKELAKEWNKGASLKKPSPSSSDSGYDSQETNVDKKTDNDVIEHKHEILLDTSEADKKAEEFKYNLENFDALTLKDEIKTIGMQIEALSPTIAHISNKIKNGLSGAISEIKTKAESIKSSFGKVTPVFSKIGEKASKLFSPLKDNISKVSTDIKTKFGQVSSIFRNIKDVGKNAFVQLGANIKEQLNTAGTPLNKLKNSFSTIKNVVSKPVSAIKTLVNKIKGVGSESDKAKSKTTSLGSSLTNIGLSLTKEFSKGFSSVSKSISSGIGSIKKFALSLLSVRNAFNMIGRAAQSYLSFDSQLQGSIQNSWNVLGSLLAPVLEYVAGLFSQLVSIVANFIKMLTGIDLVAKANAKALDKQAESTKKTSQSAKQLSGIDDIDNLSSGNTSDSGGGEATTLTVEDIDIGPLNKFFEEAKQIFSKIFDPFIEAWQSVGTEFTNSFVSMISNVADLGKNIFGSIFEVWTNGTGTKLIQNSLKMFNNLFKLIGNISKALTQAWSEDNLGTEAIQTIADAFASIQEVIIVVGESLNEIAGNGTFAETFTLLLGILQNVSSVIDQIAQGLSNAWTSSENGQKIFQAISNIFNDILKFTKSISESLLKWVMSEEFQVALENVFNFFKDIFEIAEDIAKWVLEMYDKYLKPVLEDKIIPAINNIIDAISDIWKVVEPVVKSVINIIQSILEPVIDGLSSIIGGIATVIGGIAKFVSGVFSGDWKKAWEGISDIFSGIWDAIWAFLKGIINAMIAGFESLVNLALDALKFLLDPLADIGNTILDLIGVDFTIPKLKKVKLPRLQYGQVAYEEQTAVIGEYANARNNPEIVSPVSMMKDSFRDVLNEFDFSGTRFEKLIVNVAGDNFYDDAIDYINDKSERMGVSVIKEV